MNIYHVYDAALKLRIILVLLSLLSFCSISLSQINEAPESNISRTIANCYPADTKEHIEANISILENAIATYGTKDPWAGKAFFLLSTLNGDLNKRKEALVDLDACLKLPEPYAGLHLAAQQMKMVNYSELKDKKKAIQAASALIKTPGPSSKRDSFVPSAYLLKAQWQDDIAKRDKKKIMAAVKTYKEFVTQSKGHSGKDWIRFQTLAVRSLAETLAEAGKNNDSAKIYNDYLKRFPNDPASSLMAMERLSVLKGGQGKLTIKDLQDIISKHPTNSGAGQHVLYQLAYAYYMQNDLKNAIPILKKMMDFIPNKTDSDYAPNQTADAGRLLMDAYQRLGDIRERNAVALEIQRRFPDLPESTDTKIALQHYQVADYSAEIGARNRRIALTAIFTGIIALVLLRMVINHRAKLNPN
jgi:tetratricopeptide (TPR) repeat protein